MGVPSKAGEPGRFLKNCTYRADLPHSDSRGFVDLVTITIQDNPSFQLPKQSRVFHTEPVSVGDEAYYFWSGTQAVADPALSFKKHGAFVRIDLTVWRGAANDPKSISRDQVKARELVLARQVVARLP